MTHVDDLRPESRPDWRGIDETWDEVSDISSILPSSVDNWVADSLLLNSFMFFIVRLLIFVFTPIGFDEIGLTWDFRSYVSNVKRSKDKFILSISAIITQIIWDKPLDIIKIWVWIWLTES